MTLMERLEQAAREAEKLPLWAREVIAAWEAQYRPNTEPKRLMPKGVTFTPASEYSYDDLHDVTQAL